jgi:hypothetical protein
MLFDTPMERVYKGEPNNLAKYLVDGQWRRIMDDDMAKSRYATWNQQKRAMLCHSMCQGQE